MVILRLKEIRVQKKMTQCELARRSGMTQTNISLIEAGKVRPNIDTVGRLAAALGVPVTALFAGGDEASGDATRTGTA